MIKIDLLVVLFFLRVGGLNGGKGRELLEEVTGIRHETNGLWLGTVFFFLSIKTGEASGLVAASEELFRQDQQRRRRHHRVAGPCSDAARRMRTIHNVRMHKNTSARTIKRRDHAGIWCVIGK